jgi:catechol 2,3-dioxygenase
VHLHVADLRGAETFYTTVLGFEQMQRLDRSALFLSAGGYHHHIGLNIWAGAGAPPPPVDAVGLRYFTIQVPDEAELARVAERLQATDAPFERTTSVSHTAAALLLRDPSSNGILVDVCRGNLE